MPVMNWGYVLDPGTDPEPRRQTKQDSVLRFLIKTKEGLRRWRVELITAGRSGRAETRNAVTGKPVGGV